MINNYDYIIIGGGVVGLATAYLLKDYNVLVLEKESKVSQHQSGRNSGVIHSGIYYKPGSLKSITCLRGKMLLEEFCQQNNIPVRTCGKLIITTEDNQFSNLVKLHHNALTVGINCKMVNKFEIKEIEPHAVGVNGLHVKDTGIVDFKQVCQEFRRHTRVFTHNRVIKIQGDEVTTNNGVYRGKYIINCAGLYADKIAKMCGVKTDLQIIPFRGVYYTLKEQARHLCKSLIYPVPDPQFPFLGVHFTSTIDGGVEVGPNAVLALGREAYTLWDTSIKETAEIFAFSGARKLFAKHWRMGLKEMWTAISKKRYVKELRKLVPDVKSSDLLHRPSGIRAQAVDRCGNLVDDFRLVREGRVLHVLNAPSPAATASLAIAEKIVDVFHKDIEVI